MSRKERSQGSMGFQFIVKTNTFRQEGADARHPVWSLPPCALR